MNIIEQLSSKTGDKTELSNIKVAVQCLESPTLLTLISKTLSDRDEKLAADCAEVMTKVAEEKPTLILPYVSDLLKLLQHKNTKARWEAIHALSLIAEYVKEDIKLMLPLIKEIIHSDKSTIARDYAVDIAANYAKCGKEEAAEAFPILKEALYVWDSKHAGHALKGLVAVAELLANYKSELLQIGVDFGASSRGVISKAAKKLIKTVEGR
jgi:vesicle coat complex subunit